MDLNFHFLAVELNVVEADNLEARDGGQRKKRAVYNSIPQLIIQVSPLFLSFFLSRRDKVR